MNYIITYFCGRKINVNENTVLFLALNAFSCTIAGTSMNIQSKTNQKQSSDNTQEICCINNAASTNICCNTNLLLPLSKSIEVLNTERLRET